MKTHYIIINYFFILLLIASACKKPEPAVDFSMDKDNVQAPIVVNFTNATTDADNYEWDFGDGASSTDVNPSHEYITGGNHTVSLSATGEGGTTSVSKTITIISPIPVADFTMVKTNAKVNETIVFSNKSQYATTYLWDFGDGNTSTDESPSYSYPIAGTYAVKLAATGEGNSSTVSKNLTIIPKPIANFSMDKTTAETGETITFTNSTHHATNFVWDFGDGNTSSKKNPTHAYTDAGDYDVKLTSSGLGGTDTKTIAITIIESGQWLSYDDGTFEDDFAAQSNYYRFWVRFDKPSGWANLTVTKVRIRFSSSSGDIDLICHNWRTSNGYYWPNNELYSSDNKTTSSGWNEWDVDWTLDDDRFFVGYYQPGSSSPDLYYDSSNSDVRSYLYYYSSGFRYSLFNDVDWAIQIYVEPNSGKIASNKQNKGMWLNSKHVKKNNQIVNKNLKTKYNVISLKQLGGLE